MGVKVGVFRQLINFNSLDTLIMSFIVVDHDVLFMLQFNSAILEAFRDQNEIFRNRWAKIQKSNIFHAENVQFLSNLASI